MEKISVDNLYNVAETLLIPLYFKAKETQEQGLLFDDIAVGAVGRIDYDFARFDKDRLSQTGVAVRTMLLDQVLEELTTLYPDLLVVNLGAGLDTRPERYPDLAWVNVDFREVMDLRRKIFPNTRSINLSQSILDFSWLDHIPVRRHVLFICEGVLMYLYEKEVRELFLKLAAGFSEAYLAFDTIPEFMVGRSHRSVDTRKAPFCWGNGHTRKIERWSPAITTYKTFFFSDYLKQRWGWMRLAYCLPFIRKGFKIAVMKLN
jgi:O-methyltransferase involved in polyketide biosynthesis